MVSGRQTLGSIERTLGELRQEETAMKRAVETAMADIADLRRAELDAYRELARFRLRDGGEHAFGQRIDRDEAEARKRLEQRFHAQVNAATAERQPRGRHGEGGS